MPDCAHCGNPVPAGARFCPECGRALAAADATAVGPPRRRWPPDPLLVVVVLVAGGAIFLLASGEWAWGLVALLAAGLLFLSQREAERRAARYALAGVGARFSARRETWAARSRGQLEIFRVRRELAELEAERARGFQELGRAVYAGDEAGIDQARAAIDSIAERIRDKEAEIDTLIAETEKRVQRAQAGVRATERMEAPPEPARVPEPWPPPDEGEPPSPAPVPEPYPPGEPPPEPEHPPMPQTGREGG